ncbi:MAG: hypothetical protein ACE37F_21245 [Nannocystaceae bacterium]|nr:hypothetical protein [bacterium]
MPAPPIPPLVPDGAEFTFGKSPFRVKGVLYRATRSYFETNVTGGYEALLAVLEPPALRAFMEQPHIASKRYDVMPVPSLIAYEARVVNTSLEAYLVERTRWQAKQDLRGVYRVLLKVIRPGLIIRRLPRLLTQLFDFPTVDVDVRGENELIATFSGVPQPLEVWLSIGFSVYTKCAMEAAGAWRVKTDWSGSDDAGSRAGLPLRALRMHVTWE